MELVIGMTSALGGIAFGVLLSYWLQQRGRRDEARRALQLLSTGIAAQAATWAVAMRDGAPLHISGMREEVASLQQLASGASFVLSVSEAETVDSFLASLTSALRSTDTGWFTPNPADVLRVTLAARLIEARQQVERLAPYPWNWRERRRRASKLDAILSLGEERLKPLLIVERHFRGVRAIGSRKEAETRRLLADEDPRD